MRAPPLRRRPRCPAAVVAVLGVAVVAACTTETRAGTPSTAGPSAGPTASGSVAPRTAPATSSSPEVPSATDTPVAPTTSVTPTSRPAGGDACPPPADADVATGEATQLREVGSFEGGTVLAGVYPVPDERGEPWSQWGEGVVLPDGRFVSAVGDHRGRDGRSWFYEYDPDARTLVRTTEVSAALDHRAGDWGYGKIHAPMVLDACDRVVTATYWGTRRDIEFGGSYRGDHLVRYDPATRAVESIGVPAPGHGIPSLSISPDRSTLYVEAVDPASDPDAGRFLAVDTMDGDVLAASGSADHVGFRDVLVTADGTGLHAAGDGGLAGFDPSGTPVREPDAWTDGWLRSATDPAPDGTVGFVTRHPDVLHRRDADGTVADLGPLEGYVASLALAPDGRTALYVPGAHGDGWRSGTPLIAADLRTGDRTELVRLNDLIEPELGVGVGGTYDVVVDPGGRRVFVGLNGGEDLEESAFGSVVLAVVELDEGLRASGDDGDRPRVAPAEVCRTDLGDPGSGGEVDGPFELVDVTADLGLLDPLTGMHGHAAAAGDVDGDGWSDLFVGGFADRPPDDYAVRGAAGPAPDQLLLGGPSGFRPDGTFPGRRARTSGATFADLDADGDLDLVIVRNPRPAGPIARVPTVVVENTPTGWVERAELGDDVAGRAAAVLDVDGDGLSDVLLAGDRSGETGTRAYRNDGAFSFTDVTSDWGVPTDLAALALATVDVDGDGWRDVVVNGDPRMLLGGPDGFRVERVPQLAWDRRGDEDDPAGIAVGDLDGDQRPDLVLGQHFNSTVDDGARVPVRILVNRSSGTGVELVEVTGPAGSPALWTKSPHVAVVDVDADGHVDVVTSAVTAGGAPLVLANTGVRGGVPRLEPVGRPGRGDYFVTGVTTDLDRDGRQDVFQVAWEPTRASRAFRVDGAAGAAVEVDLSALPDPAGAAVVVTAADGTVRTTWAASTTGYGAGAPGVVHVGLGPPEAAGSGERVHVEVRPARASPIDLGSTAPGTRLTFGPCP